MSVQTLLSGGVNIDYQQFYIQPGGESTDMSEAFQGQVNGICGAAQRGHLFLCTGLHVGIVHVTVTLRDDEPPIDHSWDEIVECSFQHQTDRLVLMEWGREDGHILPLPGGTYRVRYSALSMLADWQIADENSPSQRYALEFWPAIWRSDEIVKITGECAQYWHSEAGKSREA